MSYNQKLVASIKSKGQILREFKDTVYIKFGSEYSLLLKNLNSVRALINVYIDGENVVPGGLVLNAGQTTDLERWIKNGNLNEGNRFKFIERTADIEQHRGIKLEDGLIRVEYSFERVSPTISPNWWHDYHQIYGGYKSKNQVTYRGMNGYLGIATGESTLKTLNSVSPLGQSYSTSNDNYACNDIGITVPGSKSEQKFTTCGWFPTETETHVIVLKLLGETPNNKPVMESITVKAKPKCVTCGHTNKATAKFCNKCGTALEIFA